MRNMIFFSPPFLFSLILELNVTGPWKDAKIQYCADGNMNNA